MTEVTNKGTGVALVTSRYWEGAFALKTLVDSGIPFAGIMIQKTWWRDHNSADYSGIYMRLLEQDRGSSDRQYYTIEEIASERGIPVQPVENINDAATTLVLEAMKPSLLIVVGSRIIQQHLIERYPERIINYHTGLLPQYRGPYSEFWAIHQDRPEEIGTTIHLIDSGIDTGPVLARRPTCIPSGCTPQEAHVINARAGAGLLAEAVIRYLAGEIRPTPQDEKLAKYYSYPTEEQIEELGRRMGESFSLHFAD